jgi:hypothetical protein
MRMNEIAISLQYTAAWQMLHMYVSRGASLIKFFSLKSMFNQFAATCATTSFTRISAEIWNICAFSYDICKIITHASDGFHGFHCMRLSLASVWLLRLLGSLQSLKVPTDRSDDMENRPILLRIPGTRGFTVIAKTAGNIVLARIRRSIRN